MSAFCCSPGFLSPPRPTLRSSLSSPDFISSFIGQIILFLVTWALFHHLVGGVRHIIWDSGYGLDAPLRDQMAWATLIGGFALTVIVWIIGYAVW